MARMDRNARRLTSSGAHSLRWKAAVEDVINRLRIQTVKAHLELRRIVCASLASKLDNGYVTVDQRAAIAVCRDALLREGDLFAFYLELLRRKQKERAWAK